MAAKMSVLDQVKKRWQQLTDKEKQFKDIAKVHIDLVERMEKHAPHVTAFTMPNDEKIAKLKAKTPLMEGAEEQVDLRFAVALFRDLTDWSGTGDERKQLKKWGKSLSDQEIEKVLRGWLKGDLEPFTRWTLENRLPQDAITVLIQYSLLPTLYKHTEGLLPDKSFMLESWSEGFCPVCGDQAALGEIRDSERFRYLRCMSCGSDWPFRRIKCPVCDNHDHEKLESFLIEDEKTGGTWQVDVCEECKSYLKVSHKLQPSEPEMLILDDLSTTHLDMFAVEQGYYKGGKPDGTLQ
ncbi:formate dehydrogenase accessory protein FdhE [Effusibacillus dendaii]|uniref:Formate dehydrogenase accessory protein FdhE n=1 Tax=Effusibacillus dendaii TaxID=2743772 RepID=A0A7I8D8D2_9BACL|nr:formate dehydrogenase accessory protein FdhE [Effusibacillus dendaii]BCJ86374.1 hypothetical protein skT53_13590 [Effusibacillus dendaii]